MAATPIEKRSVLFICLGNICRSPIADAILQHLLTERGEADEWLVDSAAIADYNIGSQPDKRALKTLEKHGIIGYSHKARIIRNEDFRKFDVIFGMDEHIMSDLEELKPKGKTRAKLLMLGDLDPEKDRIIVDPYFSRDEADFDKVFEQCMRCIQVFLASDNS